MDIKDRRDNEQDRGQRKSQRTMKMIENIERAREQRKGQKTLKVFIYKVVVKIQQKRGLALIKDDEL